MKKTEYRLHCSHMDTGFRVRIAVVADLHGNPPDAVLRVLRDDPPDFIAAAGDIGERLDGSEPEATGNLLRFFKEAVQLAPVVYSYGNHEIGACGHFRVSKISLANCGTQIVLPELLARIRETGVTFLDDAFTDIGNIRFGGLTSGMVNRENRPRTDWLKGFCAGAGTDGKYRVLLCHHPEYYEPYLKALPIDLILSGHAHGGQWRFFGRGIFAPCQGLFPKYTSGVTDGRFVISRGTGDHTWIPRLFNPHEVVYVTVTGDTVAR